MHKPEGGGGSRHGVLTQFDPKYFLLLLSLFFFLYFNILLLIMYTKSNIVLCLQDKQLRDVGDWRKNIEDKSDRKKMFDS